MSNKIIDKRLRGLMRGHVEEMMNMTEEELITSKPIINRIESQIRMLLEKYPFITTEAIAINDNTTAYTDGNHIVYNLLSPLIVGCKDFYDMFLSAIGSASHECAHVLYTNFRVLNKIRREISMSCFEFKYSEELKTRNKYVKNLFINEAMDMINIIEDCYIENCLYQTYPEEGILIQGLIVGNYQKYAHCPNMDDLLNRVSDKKLLLIQLFNAILQIKECLGYTPNGWDKVDGEDFKILSNALDKARPYVKEYKWNSNPKEKTKCIKALLEICYELLPSDDFFDELMNKNNKNQENGDQTQNSDDSSGGSQSKENKEISSESNSSDSPSENNESDESKEEKLKELIDELIKNSSDAKKETGMSKNISSSNNNEALEKPIFSNDKTEHANTPKTDKTEAMERLIKDVAKDVAEDEIAKQENSELQKTAEKIKRENFHGSMTSISVSKIYDNDKNVSYFEYNNALKRVKSISTACQRSIKQILAKDSEEFEEYMNRGNRICAKRLWRDDNMFFIRKHEPTEVNDVVFGLCIDTSGSMCGERIQKAIDVAVLFDDLCRGIKIPHRIISHSAIYTCDIKNIVNYNGGEKEKFAIPSITAGGCNIDTMVLSTLAEDMLKRNEETKVLIMISDGAPCDYRREDDAKSFKGLAYKEIKGANRAEAELNACIRYYRRRGIKVIGVSLCDYDAIKAIYEEGILNCEDLSTLPKEMARLFKRYVLR